MREFRRHFRRVDAERTIGVDDPVLEQLLVDLGGDLFMRCWESDGSASPAACLHTGQDEM